MALPPFTPFTLETVVAAADAWAVARMPHTKRRRASRGSRFRYDSIVAKLIGTLQAATRLNMHAKKLAVGASLGIGNSAHTGRKFYTPRGGSCPIRNMNGSGLAPPRSQDLQPHIYGVYTCPRHTPSAQPRVPRMIADSAALNLRSNAERPMRGLPYRRMAREDRFFHPERFRRCLLRWWQSRAFQWHMLL